jgi:hypothetical protein
VDPVTGLGQYLPVLGPSALLSVAVLMLLTRRLVTSAELREARQDRDTWRRAAETHAATVAELSGHVGRLSIATQQLLDLHRQPPGQHQVVTGRQRWPVG